MFIQPEMMESKPQRKLINLHKRCHTVDKKKSCTTWDVGNPVNSEINYLSAGTGFLPFMSSISECKVNAKLSMKNLLQDNLWTRWKTLQTVRSVELFWNRNRSIEIPTSPLWQYELNIDVFFKNSYMSVYPLPQEGWAERNPPRSRDWGG